jgi:hypothetical protein
VGWDWRLRTAASTGLLFIPGWLWCGPWYDGIDWGLTPNLLPERSGSHQYCLAVLSAETSLKRLREWTKEMRIQSIRPRGSSSDLLTCRKILWHGTSVFTSPPKEDVLRNCIALTNPSPWPGLNPRTLGPVASILTTTPGFLNRGPADPWGSARCR